MRDFDGSIVDFVQHPDYYNGIYNAVPVVVVADKDETMVMVQPSNIEVEYIEAVRSYTVEGCTTSDGSDASIRIEHHHQDETEVTHVLATIEDRYGENQTYPATRWGIEQMEGLSL